jgi:hypothetical protein
MVKNMISTRLLFFTFLISSSLSAKGQAGIEMPSDTVAQDSVGRFHLYVAASYSGQQFVETVASFANLSAGIIYDDRLGARIFYGAILDDFRKQVIFPTSYTFEQSNLGLHIQYSFLKKRIRPVAGLSFQLGQIAWRPEGDSEDLFTDNVLMYGAFVGGAWAIYKSLTLQADVGYTLSTDMELIGLEKSDPDGLRFEVMLKFGVFRF